MNAEIVSVGTEILLGQIVDTNAAVLGDLFAELGISHTHRQTVGDNLDRLVGALKLALSRSDVVVTIGGLGPTLDDLTRQGIAAALEDEMVLDEGVANGLRELFKSRRLPWTEAQDRQAMRPTCATAIDNPNGTAPGLICRKGGKTIIAMPGPKFEFTPMAHGPVRAALMQAGAGGQVIHSRTVRIAGMGESMVERELGPEIMNSEQPTVAPYAKTAEVHLRVTARAATVAEADTLIDPMVARIREKLGPVVYGFNETTLEAAVIARLVERGETIATAESCTGGLLGGRLTSVAGASEALFGGFVAYSAEQKIAMLDVPADVIAVHTVYSEECAAAMATGARARLGSTWALSITGIAGPDGGTEDKPVGLVYVGLAGPDGVSVTELRSRGDRETIRFRATQTALVALRKALM